MVRAGSAGAWGRRRGARSGGRAGRCRPGLRARGGGPD
ncbi:hypothetical protein ATKI12_2119 [Kitasatospora sp. Ki12]